MGLNAPDVLIDNECRMLFEALLALHGSALFQSATAKIVEQWLEAYAEELARQEEPEAEE
jgi:hypothetical protein